jgi:hypothetical protein
MSRLPRSLTLPAGPRVRLRLVHRSDVPALRELLERRGVQPSELALSRLAYFDPRERVSVCALAWIGGGETLVGVASCELALGAEPDTLVVDERLSDGLGPLLGEALAERTRSSRARRAA